jgi:hypothetical protein
MAIQHTPFEKQKHPPSAPNHMKGDGYSRRCAECRHFLEEHVHPHTFCRCCNAGPQPLPAEGGIALGFRDDRTYVEGSAGTEQGAEYPKHLHLYSTQGHTVSKVVNNPTEEAAAREQGYFGNIKEYRDEPARLAAEAEKRKADEAAAKQAGEAAAKTSKDSKKEDK